MKKQRTDSSRVVSAVEPMDIEPLDAPPVLPPGTRALEVIEVPQLLAHELSSEFSDLSKHLHSFPQVLSHIAHGNNDCYLAYGADMPPWVRLPVNPVLLSNTTLQPSSEQREKAVIKHAIVDSDYVHCDDQLSTHGEWRGYVCDFFRSYEIVGVALVFTNLVNVATPTVELRVKQPFGTQVSTSTSSPSHPFSSYHRHATPLPGYWTTGVVAMQGVAFVVPASTEYRVSNTDLIDPSQPGSFLIVRVVMMHLTSDRVKVIRANIPSEDLEELHWSEEPRLVAPNANKSPEEERLIQYALSSDNLASSEEEEDDYDSLSDEHSVAAPDRPSWPPIAFRSPFQRRSKTEEPHLASLECISALSNSLEWWTGDFSTRNALVTTQQEKYLHCRLKVGVPTALDAIVQEVPGSIRREPCQHGDENDDPDPPEEVSPEDTMEEQDDLPLVFAQLALIKSMHRRISGSSTASTSLAKAPDELLWLVQAYRATSSIEMKTAVLREYLGGEYPVEPLLPRLDAVVRDVEVSLARWCEWLVRAADATRASIDDPVVSTAVDVLIRDDLGSQTVNEALARLRKALLQLGPSVQFRATWTQYGNPNADIVPTFSVPRTGSIESRMEAMIGTASTRTSNKPIPSDVSVDTSGNAKSLSYIRGLHPRQHREVYKLLEATLSAMLPLFDALLAQLEGPTPTESRFWSNAGKLLRSPLVVETHSKEEPPISRRFLRGRNLQIIVEIVEIELSDNKTMVQPLKEHYGDRENLVATGVSFVAVDNISEPRIHVHPRYSGLRYDASIGFVTARTGRCAVYPSHFDTTVMPFQRQDETKRGSLLMVKFHLVNPFAPQVSTANLCPEFREWVVDATVGQVARHFDLPTSVHDEIVAMVPWSDQLISDSTWVTS